VNLRWILAAFASPAWAGLQAAHDVNPDPRIFEAYLTADEHEIPINGTLVHAMVYRDESTGIAGIPAPEIRVHVGDLVILHFRNDLDADSASIHWHGLEPDNDSDGTAVTQDAVLPGQSYTYRFRISRPGLYWYHSHMLPGGPTFAGMYGPIVIESDIETSLKGSVLPAETDTHSLVLSDIEFDPLTGKVGKPLGGVITEVNELVQLCVLGNEGDPSGNRGACSVLFPGNTVLVNGEPPSASAQMPSFVVASGQRIRLRLFNAAIARHFRLRLVGSADNKLYRIGGEGGLLDSVQLDGGVKGTWDTSYDLGEITIGSGERADVIVVPSGAEGATVRLVGARPGPDFLLSAGLPAEYPLAFFRIRGSASDVPPAVGDSILAGTTEDVENLKDDPLVTPLIDPPPGGVGSGDETIRLTARTTPTGRQPSIDSFSAMLDSNTGNGDFLTLSHPPTARFARVGDLLELAVLNDAGPVHPFHLHGFSFQPVRVQDSAGPPRVLYSFDYDEFIDSMDVYPGQTFVFRVRLDDRPRICDSSGFPADPGPTLAPCDEAACGGAVGRWLFHCHIFQHAGLGMMSELTVLGDEAGPLQIECPPDITIGADPGQCSAVVTFDTPAATGGCSPAVVTCTPPSGSAFPKGTSTVTCSATTEDGSTSSCAFRVLVEDREPPEVNGSVAESRLWPPDHGMVDVGLAVVTADNCSTKVTRVQVFSDEDGNARPGPGKHSPDAVLTDPGLLRLRAERDGDGDGRVYLILLTTCDQAGNRSSACRTVVVPKDKSQGSLAQVEAAAATASALCEAAGGVVPPGYSEILDSLAGSRRR